MAEFKMQCFGLFLLFGISLCVQFAWAIKIDIQPRKYDGSDETEVKIFCTIDEGEAAAKEIMMLKVSRKGERAIAMVHPNSSITYHAGNQDEFLATGKIDPTTSRSYMTVIIKTPEPEDTGTYTCNIFYLDTVGVLVEDKASEYLSVDDPEVEQLKATVKALVKKAATGESDVKKLKTQQTTVSSRLESFTSTVTLVSRDTSDIKDSVDGYKLKITELTNQVKKQTNDIKDLQAKEAAYKTQLIEMQDKVGEQASQIKNMTDKENRLDNDIDILRADEAQLEQQVVQLVNSSSNCTSGCSSGSSSSSSSSGGGGNAVPVIVFSATNQNLYVDAQVGRTPIFPDVILNEGNGYDSKTGIFTAPVDGIYVFHLIIKLNCHDCYVQVGLLANNALLIKLNAGAKDDAPQNSVSAVQKLAKGDTVKPYTESATANTLFTINRLSVFSGYIINMS